MQVVIWSNCPQYFLIIKKTFFFVSIYTYLNAPCKKFLMSNGGISNDLYYLCSDLATLYQIVLKVDTRAAISERHLRKKNIYSPAFNGATLFPHLLAYNPLLCNPHFTVVLT